jgi:truncated hemoglobin YjbI
MHVPLCREKKGKYTRLAGRHANYNIGSNAANRWVEHMHAAIEEHDELQNDQEAKRYMKSYFTYTAHYIVAAMEYMRPDQLSGGTQIDKDRIW